MLQTKVGRAYEDKLAGTISEELWRESHQKWMLELEMLKRQIDVMDDQKDEYINEGAELIELVQHFESIYKNATPEKKRRITWAGVALRGSSPA
jgi:hypothetical protein